MGGGAVRSCDKKQRRGFESSGREGDEQRSEMKERGAGLAWCCSGELRLMVAGCSEHSHSGRAPALDPEAAEGGDELVGREVAGLVGRGEEMVFPC